MSRTAILNISQVKKAYKIYSEGKSLQDTASEFGVTRQSLRNNFGALELKIRPKGPATFNKKKPATHGLFWPEKILTNVRKLHVKINEGRQKKKKINKLVPELIQEGIVVYNRNKKTKEYVILSFPKQERKRLNVFLPTELDNALHKMLSVETYEKNDSFEYYKISEFCMILIDLAIKERSKNG